MLGRGMAASLQTVACPVRKAALGRDSNRRRYNPLGHSVPLTFIIYNVYKTRLCNKSIGDQFNSYDIICTLINLFTDNCIPYMVVSSLPTYSVAPIT